MRRAGFTLIEIMIVAGIIAIMLAGAVMSIASGRGAVQVKEATRGVIQLSRYAYALALLKQRPVVVTFFHDGKVEVRISGEATGSDAAGSPADPFYREVAGVATKTAEEYLAAEADESGDGAEKPRKGGEEHDGEAAPGGDADGGKSGKDPDEKGFFYTRRVLDPEMLAKEDAEGKYEGVTFTVEVLGEDGEPLDPSIAASLSLPRPKRKREFKSDASLFIDGVRIDDDGEPVEDEQESDTNPPVSVTYETNGNVVRHRIIVRLNEEGESSEGFVINVSRTGKATVGDEDEEEVPNAKRRRRR